MKTKLGVALAGVLFGIGVYALAGMEVKRIEKNAAYTVITQGSRVDLYLSDKMEEPNAYINMYAEIGLAPKEETIYIHLAGNGGSVQALNRFYEAIQTSKATVVTVIEGPVYSAHAALAMMGSRIDIVGAGHFMFHSPAIVDPDTQEAINPILGCKWFKGKKDRGQDLEQKCIEEQTLSLSEDEAMFSKVVYPYLTRDEQNRMHQGYDINITNQNMRERIKYVNNQPKR